MGFPPLIKALLDPRSYRPRPSSVKLVQTHISYILLTDDIVYKIKKPVDFGFLDFSSLANRLYFCNEEVRLNRRLAPGVYLGVSSIVGRNGGFAVEGEGEPVEYAVKMRRLRAESILEEALRRGSVTEDTIERVAARISEFHRTAATDGRISSFGFPAVIKKNTDENFAQSIPFIGRTISPGLFERIRDYTEGFLRADEDLLLKRVEGGFIRDCHGDIHTEHVSIDDGINIFDCVEFNERFRFSDVVADSAFLSMDLDYHNRADLARVFDSAYLKASGDPDGARLLDFYKCYRAYVRGKVAGFKLMETEVDERQRSLALLDARRHFHLSGLYSSGGFRPSLVAVAGLSGTGKSTVARILAEESCFVRLSSDGVRKELAGLKPSEHRFEGYGSGIYSEEFTERTYAEMMTRALSYLEKGRSVVLDATFSRKRFIEAAKKTSARSGSEFHLIECVAPDETVKNHLLKRRAGEEEGTEAVSDADWSIYLKQKAEREPLTEPRLILSSDIPMDKRIEEAVEKIFG